MDNEYVEFTKDMEPIDTVQHTEGTAQQPASAANPLRPTALISER